MKALFAITMLLAAASLTDCSGGWADVPNPGNPSAMAYAGAPGSVLDWE